MRLPACCWPMVNRSANASGYDEQIENMAMNQYPETGLLKQVHGVGNALTALTFVLTVEDPHTIPSETEMPVPTSDWPGGESLATVGHSYGITKEGDGYVRKLCWSNARITFWVRLGRTATFANGAWRWPRAVVRTRRKGPWWRSHGNWPSCCTSCG